MVQDLKHLQLQDQELTKRMVLNQVKIDSLIMKKAKEGDAKSVSALTDYKKQYQKLQDDVTLQTNNQTKANNTIVSQSAAITNVDISKLMTKQDASNLMTKKEYEQLKNEIAALKSEMMRNTNAKSNTAIQVQPRGWRRRNKTIQNTYITNPNAKEVDVRIVRDTIYIDKPIERIVERIVRDTIVNTIEKNNVITKTEQKIELVNNDLANLLEMEPEVVLFDNGVSVVKSVYFARLNSLAKKVMKFSDVKIHLKGHTDNVGNPVSNLALSQKRAKAVER